MTDVTKDPLRDIDTRDYTMFERKHSSQLMYMTMNRSGYVAVDIINDWD